MLRKSIEHSFKSFYKRQNLNLKLYLLLFCRALFIIAFDMEATQFEYSTKNVPLPSEENYCMKLTEKTEQLCKRMRWRAYFYLHPEVQRTSKENHGFNSRQSPPQVPELISFENRMLNLIQSIKFKKPKCKFQKKLATDASSIKKSEDLFVPAEKTTNFYKMDPNSYNELLHKNVTKTYKKVPAKVVHNIQNEAKGIAEKLNLADRINTTAQREAFITLKDHKPNFQNNPSCRLINPSKSEIRKISKNILYR